MYCKHCGQEISDDSVVCPNCGCAVERSQQTKQSNLTGESKTWLGALLGFFVGIIGLIIGIVMFPEGTVERKTFIKGWCIAFFVGIALSVVIYIIYFAVYAAILL